MTESPRALAREALGSARDAPPAYPAVRGRKDYAARQLFATPALETFLKTDYRGVAQSPTDFAEIRDDLGQG